MASDREKKKRKKKTKLLGRTGALKTEELISVAEVGWSLNTLHRSGTFSCPEQSSTASPCLGSVLDTWCHHRHLCPQVQGISQGQGESWGARSSSAPAAQQP